MRTIAIILGVTAAISATNLSATRQTQWAPTTCPLMTQWAKDVSPSNAHPEYPRPQFVRENWQNLNGLWDLAIINDTTSGVSTQPAGFPEKILVPFPVESALSGIGKRADHLWYRREFSIPTKWSAQRIMLRFEAVDYQCVVYLNGKMLGEHRGGYDPFSFDITDALKPGDTQEITVGVFDPSDAGNQPRGKQVNNPKGIWYTPSSGIWQTVWIEPVPEKRIDNFTVTPDLDAGQVILKVDCANTGPDSRISAVVLDGSRQVSKADGRPGEVIRIPIKNPKLWSPDTPFLYDLRLSLNQDNKPVDTAKSYFGMRKIEVKSDGKFQRICLNGKPIFQIGPLDQGFWPDGLHTAPTDAALKSDLELIKRLGFNMLRKHIKVEPARWYYWADKLGLLVWQDMPSGDNKTPEAKKEFEDELRRMIEARRNSPAIIMWVVFNEGWGEFDKENTVRLTNWVKQFDPTRLVNNASGWTDAKAGDVSDMHKYPGPGCPDPETARASVLGEFGGLGLKIEGHTWAKDFWGYQGTASRENLASRYEQLLRRVWMLAKEKGLCAAIYTQITDVETECNGLITYDREVVKIDEKRAANANRGKLPPVVIKTIVPTSEKNPISWNYTETKPDKEWATPTFDDSQWKQAPAGFGTADTGGPVHTEWKSADIWLRRDFDFPTDAPINDLYLLAWHDDDVELYLNGEVAAKEKGYRTGYEELPISDKARATLKPGKNKLAIHCRHTDRGQFIDAGIIAITSGKK